MGITIPRGLGRLAPDAARHSDQRGHACDDQRVRAAKWDTECERGGVWLRRLVRRGLSGPLVISGPCVHVIYTLRDDGTPETPVLNYPGTLAGDGKSVEFRIDETQTAALLGDFYRHKIIVDDPELAGPIVLARGYFTVYGDGGEP